MNIQRRRVVGATLVLGAVMAAAHAPALAQGDWPSKPIRIVVPYPPGGSSDIIARSISQPLSVALGQPVIVENKPGANGNLGADFVAKSAPDGYTLLLCDVGALAISPSVYTKLSFDPSKDLRGVTMLAYSPHLLVVHPSVPVSNLKELVAYSKKNDLNFAVTATGSAPHVAVVALERAAGARWQYIPYKGGVTAIQDTVAGKTQILMNGMLATLPDHDWAQLVAGVRDQLKEKDKNVAERTARLFGLAYDRDGDWDRNGETLAALEKLTKDQVRDLLAHAIAPEHRQMRTFLGFARQHEDKAAQTPTYTDRPAWKKSRLYEQK